MDKTQRRTLAEIGDGFFIVLPSRVGTIEKCVSFQFWICRLHLANEGTNFFESPNVERAGDERHQQKISKGKSGSLAGCVPSASVDDDVVVLVGEPQRLRANGGTGKFDARVAGFTIHVLVSQDRKIGRGLLV